MKPPGPTTASPRGVRCVLFDLDGTLLDSAPDLAGAADDMRLARGLPSLAYQRYRPHAGSGARGMLRAAFGLAPDAPDYEPLRHEFIERYAQRMTRLTRPFEGAETIVTTLAAQGITWGVVTNKAERLVQPLLANWPWFASAVTVVCGDTTPHTKPHPAPVREALRQAGIAPDQALYVGDDERDMLAGRAAGVRTAAAAWGYLGDGADVSTWPADAVLHDPPALLNWLGSS